MIRGGKKIQALKWVTHELKRQAIWEEVRWVESSEIVGYRIEPLTDSARQEMLKRLLKKLHRMPCQCAARMQTHDVLHTTCGHVICRGRAQWHAVMQTDRPVPFGQHSRQAVIPSAEELRECVSHTTEARQDLTVCKYETGESLSTRGVI